MRTTDEERLLILEQNELVRRRWLDDLGHLKRCCICLQGACSDRARCRSEFESWAKKKWEAELIRAHHERHPGLPWEHPRDGH